MIGAEYVAEFLVQRGIEKVFLLTGGAATFLVDALGRNDKIDYRCFQHEQMAAMAADAIWRTSGKLGACMATSGPGATNLITGIACNYYDSIPAIHITGQVNQRDAEVFKGSNVRQTGFQETKIVDLVKPITKYAVQVRSGEELKRELTKAYNLAISGRMGPVLVDIPMDVQQAEVGDQIEYTPPVRKPAEDSVLRETEATLSALLEKSKRPLVLFGAGLGLGGVAEPVAQWLERTGVPFIATWNGAPYFNHDMTNYCGCIGVYGNRGANYILQNCDMLLVLGSRLDTRVRPGDPEKFAPAASIHVVDIDEEELNKYRSRRYTTSLMHLADFTPILDRLEPPAVADDWSDYVGEMKEKYYNRDISTFAAKAGTISPYKVIQRVNGMVDDDAIVIVDCGATTCWFFQIFHRTNQTIFSNGGCAPISYGLAAAIGAAFDVPDKQIVCFIGDGGFQANTQELHTVTHHGLNVVYIILNNYGYGIVKQFQTFYIGGRHEATGRGYSVPDFKAVVEAYGLTYFRVDRLEDLSPDMLKTKGGVVIDVTLHPDTLIEPKLEIKRTINDQFPYVDAAEFEAGNRFVKFTRYRG